jgi:G3E family GTPase
VEFANVIILNKIDLVTPREVENLKSIIRTLNPSARILTSTHSRVPLKVCASA